MNWKRKLSALAQKLRVSISRFSGAFVFTWLLFAVLVYDVLFQMPLDTEEKLLFTFGMGLLFSVFFPLLFERLNHNKAFLQGLAIIPAVITFLICHFGNYNSAYFEMGYGGVAVALLCVSVYLLFDQENRKLLIAHLAKVLFFVPMICGVITGGVMLCLAAIDNLLCNLNSDVYEITLYAIWVVVFVNLFLAYLPKQGDTLTTSKLYQMLVLHIGLPIYLFLMAILYVYLIKILITWKLPVGQINWFASFASLFFVFFAFATRPFDSKIAQWFRRWMGAFILPVIAVQLLAIYVRVDAYGLTTPRIISLILVGISVIFAISSLIRRWEESVFLLIGAVVLVFTLVPKINIIDLPKRSQLTILESYLVKNEMLKDGVVIPKMEIPIEDQARIESAYYYLYRAEPPLPQWLDGAKQKNAKEFFGFTKDAAEHKRWDLDFYGDDSEVTIAGYRKMIEVNSYRKGETSGWTVDGKTYTIDEAAILKQLYETYGGDFSKVPLISLSEEHALWIHHFGGYLNIETYETDSIYYSGYLLVK